MKRQPFNFILEKVNRFYTEKSTVLWRLAAFREAILMNDWTRLLHTQEENEATYTPLSLNNYRERQQYNTRTTLNIVEISVAFNDFDIQIDDLETPRAANEDDLRRAGLKMGDIIKTWKLLAEVSDTESSQSNTSFESSLMSNQSKVLDDSSTSSRISSEKSTKCTTV